VLGVVDGVAAVVVAAACSVVVAVVAAPRALRTSWIAPAVVLQWCCSGVTVALQWIASAAAGHPFYA
jgi:hypothetical protein